MRTLMSIHGAFSDVLYPAELLGRDLKAVIGAGFSFSSSASCPCSSTKLCPMRTLMSIHDAFSDVLYPAELLGRNSMQPLVLDSASRRPHRAHAPQRGLARCVR